MKQATESGSLNEQAAPMKILIVSYGFPPMASSGVLRPLRFARGLVAAGHNVAILAAEEPHYPLMSSELLADVPNEVSIERVTAPPRYWRSSLRRAWQQIVAHIPGHRILLVACSRFMRFVLRLPYPEWTVSTNRLIRRFTKKGIVLAHDCDVVLATTQPFWVLVVGADISKACNKPLVLDYQDLWTMNPVINATSAESAIESEVLKRASAVLTVSDGCTDIIRGLNPDLSDRIVTLLNGFDVGMYPMEEPETEDLSLAYVGNNYGGRSLLPLLEALAAANAPITLDIWGGITVAERELISRIESERIRYHGTVVRETALRGLAHCDVALITQIPDDEMSLPQKMYDALALGKTLLFVGCPNKCQIEVVRAVDMELYSGCTSEELTTLIQRMLSEKRDGRLSRPNRAKSFAFETTQQTQELLAVLTKVVESK